MKLKLAKTGPKMAKMGYFGQFWSYNHIGCRFDWAIGCSEWIANRVEAIRVLEKCHLAKMKLKLTETDPKMAKMGYFGQFWS